MRNRYTCDVLFKHSLHSYEQQKRQRQVICRCNPPANAHPIPGTRHVAKASRNECSLYLSSSLRSLGLDRRIVYSPFMGFKEVWSQLAIFQAQVTRACKLLESLRTMNNPLSFTCTKPGGYKCEMTGDVPRSIARLDFIFYNGNANMIMHLPPIGYHTMYTRTPFSTI